MRSVGTPCPRPASRAVVTLVAALALVAPLGADEGSHGPCASCHLSQDPSSVSAPYERPTCTRCHAGVLEAGLGAVSGHLLARARSGVPLEGSRCLDCHAAHPEGRPAQLRDDLSGPTRLNGGIPDDTTRLCLSCHPGAADMRRMAGRFVKHPVGTPLARGMKPECGPVALRLAEVVMDHGEPVRVIACTTCHFVHSGPNPDLLRWAPEQERDACGACHVEVSPPTCGDTIAANQVP